MWLPLVRRKAFTVSDIPRSAHKFKFTERDIKPNAVKAVTTLHPEMTTHCHMTSRVHQPKQANQVARQTQQTHAQKRRTHYEYYKTSRRTKQTSSDRIITERCDIQCSCICLHNAYMRATTCVLFLPHRYKQTLTDTDAAATYSRRDVDPCGFAGGHTQTIVSFPAIIMSCRHIP